LTSHRYVLANAVLSDWNFNMWLLIAGMTVFFGIHLVPTVVKLRARLVAWKGEGVYQAFYSLTAAAGLALVIYAKSAAPRIPVYDPPDWTAHISWFLMWLAVTIFPAAYLPTNLKRVMRHPFLWGVALWAVAHLLTNGDLASIVLFGAFAVYAFFDMWSANRRGAAVSQTRYPLWRDGVLLAVGLAAYLALVRLHPVFFGVAVNPG
jgi:uncharacterized membrane protein